MRQADFKLVRRGKVDFLEADIDPDRGARMLISTRRGGVSFGRQDLNLSFTTRDNFDDVIQNRKIMYNALGDPEDEVAVLRQQHSADVLLVDNNNFSLLTSRSLQGDGLITHQPGVNIGIGIGDCLAIAIYDPNKQVLANVHAGWQGTAKQIVKHAILKMENHFRCNPRDMWAIIGPGIHVASYEVGIKVFAEFRNSWVGWERFVYDATDGKGYLDMVGANEWLLTEHGVPEQQISSFNLCTHSLKSLFFSHRRDGLPGGRMLAIASMR